MHMIHVLGIDAGGTKTVCQLADENGALLAEARGPGANLQAAGELHVEKVLHDVMAEALGSSAIVPAAICLGIAGVDRPEDSRRSSPGIMRRIGARARTLVVNDALVALEAGAPGRPGVVIISGTGSIAYGRNARNEGARAGGWGHVLGDEGSGYWIGRAALRAVLREADRRGPRTALTPLLLQHFGVAAGAESDSRGLPEQPAAGGDRRAGAMRAGGVHATATTRRSAFCAPRPTSSNRPASSVARRLELGVEAVPVHPGWRDLSRRAVAARRDAAPPAARGLRAARRALLDREPAAGAVSLALRKRSGGARIPRYRSRRDAEARSVRALRSSPMTARSPPAP